MPQMISPGLDSQFELLFARFLEDCDDVVSYAKNYLAVHFKLDYVNADGDISNLALHQNQCCAPHKPK